MANQLLNAALYYASLGLPVFPLKPREKTPLTAHGFKDATTNTAIIREWWRKWPSANIGIYCRGLLVLDFDGQTGYQSKCLLEKERQPLPNTWTIKTGGGTIEEPKEPGEQHVYRVPAELDISPGAGTYGYPNLDVRAGESYICAVPSITRLSYQTIAASPEVIASAPKWLIDFVLDGSKPAPKASPPITKKIYEGEGRNAALTREAGRLLSIYKDPEVVKPMVWAYNQAVCVPPLSSEENKKTWQKSLEKWAAKANEALEYKPAEDGFHLTKPATPWPEPLAEEAFHGLAGEVVRAIEPHTEGDSAALLTNFLVAFGNSIGRGQHARAEADRHNCNLNIVQVGETSKGRKGSAWGHIRELFGRVDPVWTEQRIASGLSSGEGLIWEVRDPIEKTVKGEVTVVDEGIMDKRLLVCEAEFSAPLRVMAREGNTLSATIRQAWDSGALRILTKNSPAKATGAHISILGHVTKTELLRYLNDIEAGNGFANRFLWVCVKRARVLPEGGGCPSYQEIVPKLKATIDRARNIGELKRDATARGRWAEIYPELSEGKPGLLGAVTARSEAQVLRLSVIYAVLDGDSEIRPAHLMAALAVWDYCEASARYIFGDALGDSVADRIQGALRQSPEGLSRTNIYQLFSKHTSAARIEQALGLLQTTGRVRYEVRRTEGRPVEVWQAI